MITRQIPAIDGLRAISVTAVVVYHSQVSASGGFLAVSQFFTLSGFLVTSILLRRAADRNLEVVPFWGQRYRRLMPASLLTLAAVVVYGFALATRQQLDALQEAIPAALLQVVNWHFIVADVSYVDRFSSPSPIQHFWSLAIEEQFYLVTPVVLVGLLKLRATPRVLLLVTTAASIASTFWMYRLFDGGAELNRVYFGTDTRVSELLVGSVLAIALHYWRPALGDRARLALGGFGAVAFAATTLAFFTVSLDDAALYRGGFFLYSVLTCIVIYSLAEGTGPVHRLLAVRPLPELGRLTYAIYLFHWPLMLVLTDERTGMSGWPLLALQGAITVILAAISGRFLENPIRYRRPTPGDHRVLLVMAGVAIVVLAGALAFRYDGTQTDLAGLGEETSKPPPTNGDITTALVIADERGMTLAEGLGDTDTLRIAARLPFPCPSAATERCTGEEWSEAIADHDPDIILFHVSAWTSDDVGDLEAELRRRFDFLSARGAIVAWARIVDEASLSTRDDAFILAMDDLTSRRSDMRRLRDGNDIEAIAGDLELYARRPATDVPRVLVIGDSVSRTIGYGLERWGDSEGNATFWSAGTEGCGLVTEGETLDSTGRLREFPERCRSIEGAWKQQLDQFDPDIVLVVSTAADFQERRIGNSQETVQPGSEDFDAWLIDQYINTVDIVSASGALVVWVNPICSIDIFGVLDEPDGENAVDPERIAHVNDTIIPALVARRPAVETLDLRPFLCVDGEPLIDIDGVGTIRPDGVHFNPEGSLWLAETHGSDILAAAR